MGKIPEQKSGVMYIYTKNKSKFVVGSEKTQLT